jgi:signal transduction histidine kinase/ActR/RegA family two-component response regulator
MEAIAHAIQSGELYNIEYRIPQLSGKIVWVNVKGRMFGRRFAGVAVDITERKVSDEKLRQLAADLSETSQRKTEFLATLAHELRNPLAPLRTGLELLGMSKDDPAALVRVQTMMQRQVDQLVHLVDDLMDVARINSGKVELKLGLVDIRDTITSAIETIMPHVQKARHVLLTELADESLLVCADSTRLVQVLENILTNAVKYTQSNGRILVCARRVEGAIEISVSDNGIGIPSAALPTVFEMFNQVGRDTTHSPGGLGVGLALVRQLVELHRGTVVATSAGADQGSTFRISLPAASDQEEACAPTESVAPANDAPYRKLRILIADDNADACAALSALVQFEGHQVLTAADGDEAIRLAQSFLPELIFLDIGMPGKNGHEVAKTIRALPTLRDTTLVALTGWGTDQDRVLSRQAGFDQHLTKPVALADISRLLRAVPTHRNND